MAKRKILYVAQSAGGVAEYLYMFLKNFKDKNFENILIVSEDYKEQIERFEKIVDKIYFIPMIREINFKSDIRAIVKLKKIIKNEEPNIVYLHSSKAGAIGRIALFFNQKIKILYNAHGWYFNADIGNKKRKVFALIEKILAINTDKIINISKDEHESAIKYKIAKPEKMCIIENGIDFKKFEDNDKYREETRKEYKIKDNQIVIGVVGRLSEQKDPMTAIKAFKLIHEKNRNTKFMFIGAGELEKQILEYTRQNNLENDIIITGWVNNVEKYIPALDIAILPSKWEGFGLVIIEYMACDKPIVASNVGGIANIIKNKKNGLLFKPTEKEELAKEVEEIIKNEKLSQQIVQENKNYRKNYDINELIKRHKEIFEEE